MSLADQITYELEDVDSCEKKITIKVSLTYVRESFRKIVDFYRGQAKISGFREGKAPRSVVMAKYKGAIFESVQKKIVDESSRFVLEKVKDRVVPIMQIDSQIGGVQEGQPYNFSITFEVRPRLKLPNYKGLKLEAQKAVVTDRDIEQRIEEVLQQQARLDVVESVVIEDDFVKCTVRCLSELQEELAESLNGENRWVTISNYGGQFPGARDLIIGKKKGDKVVGNIAFPKDYTFNEKLQKQEVKIEFVIDEVQRRIAPKLNEEFAKQNNSDSVEAFKENISKSLEQESNQEAQRELSDKIVESLVAKIDCQLPKRTLEEQINHTVSQMLHERQSHQRGEQDPHTIADADEEMKKKAEKRAKKGLKTSFVFDQIAIEEGVKVEKEDLLERLQQISRMYNMPVEKLMQTLSKGDELVQIQMQIKHEKTLKKIIDLAQVTYVDKISKENEKENAK